MWIGLRPGREPATRTVYAQRAVLVAVIVGRPDLGCRGVAASCVAPLETSRALTVVERRLPVAMAGAGLGNRRGSRPPLGAVGAGLLRTRHGAGRGLGIDTAPREIRLPSCLSPVRLPPLLTLRLPASAAASASAAAAAALPLILPPLIMLHRPLLPPRRTLHRPLLPPRRTLHRPLLPPLRTLHRPLLPPLRTLHRPLLPPLRTLHWPLLPPLRTLHWPADSCRHFLAPADSVPITQYAPFIETQAPLSKYGLENVRLRQTLRLDGYMVLTAVMEEGVFALRGEAHSRKHLWGRVSSSLPHSAVLAWPTKAHPKFGSDRFVCLSGATCESFLSAWNEIRNLALAN